MNLPSNWRTVAGLPPLTEDETDSDLPPEFKEGMSQEEFDKAYTAFYTGLLSVDDTGPDRADVITRAFAAHKAVILWARRNGFPRPKVKIGTTGEHEKLPRTAHPEFDDRGQPHNKDPK